MSENNLNEVLDIQTSEEKDGVEQNAYSHEKTLKTIAIIILIAGIIATVILLFAITFTEEGHFSFTGFLTTVLTCISSITTWAVLNVLSNISINLYKLNDTLNAK
jgi:uncharacterized membrane protein